MMRYTLLVVALLPMMLGVGPASKPDPIAAQCAQLLERWKDRLAAERLTVVLAPPFVLAGDGGLHRLERYRDGTILAAQHALRATYFDAQPQEPILIFLFESAELYQRLARQWFGEQDVPHFGFYRHRDNVMLMNVATGTGTLVHELVHALMKSDFPDAPGWFNEGLASLYEQCTLDGQTITGLKNWRLPALKKAIQEDRLRPLSELIDDPRFYREDLTGLNYAQARYLLLYLQDKGLLREYYRRFRAARGEDPTGRKTLEYLIWPQSLDDFDRAWRAWVLAL